MKILLSGHTKGIGLAIYEHFTNLNYEVVGYSRTNSLDLLDRYTQIKFIMESVSSDIIILNANIGFKNVGLFYDLCKALYKRTEKTIIVLGSHSTETTKLFVHPYQIEKIALEEAARQIQGLRDYPNIVILRPGYVDTPAAAKIKDQQKISPNSIAKLIESIITSNTNNDYKILNILVVPK